MSQAQELVAYYQDLLIQPYSDKPKAVATIGTLVGGGDGQHGVVANALPLQVRGAFDLKTAVGQQLDFLGELIGPARYLNGLDISKTFMGVPDYDDLSPGTYQGLDTYDLPQPPAWYTMTYDDFVTSTLSDGDYRRVLMFMAQINASDYSYASLDATCYTFFAGNVNLKITGNMAITYQHLTTDPDNLFEIINQMGLLPSPAGVSVTVQEVAAFG